MLIKGMIAQATPKDSESMLPPLRFHVKTEGDAPLVTQLRALGKINSGLYCGYCGEFVCLAAEESKPLEQQRAIEFLADGPLLLECPYCQRRENRHVSEIRRMTITEKNKKKDQDNNDSAG